MFFLDMVPYKKAQFNLGQRNWTVYVGSEELELQLQFNGSEWR